MSTLDGGLLKCSWMEAVLRGYYSDTGGQAQMYTDFLGENKRILHNFPGTELPWTFTAFITGVKQNGRCYSWSGGFWCYAENHRQTDIHGIEAV